MEIPKIASLNLVASNSLFAETIAEIDSSEIVTTFLAFSSLLYKTNAFTKIISLGRTIVYDSVQFLHPITALPFTDSVGNVTDSIAS